MKQKFTWQTLNRLRVFCLTLLVSMISIGAYAQTTTAFTCIGSSGSYKSGSVNAAGTKNDGNMTTINSSTNRGWATFDISMIPGGSTIVSANLLFTTYSSTLSGAINNCYGFLGDPSTMSGASLYAACASGTSWNGSTWSANALQTKAVGAAGVAFIAANLGSNINVGYVRGSTNTYNIYGYPGGADAPQLVITYISSTPCTGAPSPGNTLASASSVCSGVSVNLSLQNSTSGSGVTYQWYNSGGLVSGATNASYSAVITSPQSFYCDVTCANGGSPITTSSTPVSVGLTTGAACLVYCSSVPTQTADEEIYQVTLNGASTNPLYANANGCTTVAPGAGSALSMYSNFRSLGPLTSIMQGATVPFEVRENECDGATYYSNGIGIWIDFNQNGSFTDPGEAVYIEPTTSAATGLSPGGDKVVSGLITIPIGATVGSTVMRVISAEGYAGTGLTPCLAYGYGETEDFLIDITAASACAGIPNPGNTIASNTLPCPNTMVNFSLQNTTGGTGVGYQWYNNAGAIVGATTAFYSQLATGPDDVYCDVTCGSSTTSSNLVSISLNNYLACYCTPTHSFGTSGSFYGQINNVTFDAINNTSTSPATAPYYTNYAPGAGTTATIYTGTNIPLSVTIGSYGYAVAWIDWDQSGSFDASEYTYLGLESAGIPATFTTLIPVPLTAVPGITKIRVRSEAYFYPAPSATQACANLNYGESEDYTITVVIPSPCTGAPTPGNTLASATSVCPGTNVNFSLQNATIGTGVTYQWYNNGGAIAGATNSYYSQAVSIADDFYCDVTCSNLGSPITTSSNLVSIAMNPFLFCYCSTGLGGICGTQSINSVAITGTTLNNVTSGCTTPYSSFPASGSTTALLVPGVSTSFVVGTGNNGNPAQIALWIDYDQNGTFDASEFNLLSASSPSGGTTTSSIIIPVTALSGQTGMRIRTDWELSSAFLATDACVNKPYGETEDYVITIAPLPATPNAPVQANTPNCATGGDLAAVGTAPPGETWYWQTSATGTSTAFPASSNYNILANGTYYLRSQSNAYLVWSPASSSITVTNFPVGPVDPTTSAPGGNPACGTVTLVSSVAAPGTTNYWQGTDATGTSLALIADDGSTNTPFIVPANGTYYLRSRDNSSFCWSNNVATIATILTVPTAPVLGATPSSICPGGSSALTAIAPSAPPVGYTVASIPFAPIPSPGTVNAGPIGDDNVSAPFPIGFPFNFYGNTYTSFVISTNGFISFNPSSPNGCCQGGVIPTAGGVDNMIAAMWDDLYVGSPNSIDYFNLTSPNRLVVRFNDVAPCCSTTPAQYNGQIIVYESGIIEVHTTSATNGGTTTQGIEGPGGLAGTAVPGRNAAGWTATNDAYRFSPIQSIGFLWTPNGPGSGIAAGNETLANTSASPSATTTYTMTITDPVNGCTNSGTVMVDVLPIPPAPSATGGATPCGVGSATLTAMGTGGTLNWYDVPVGGSIVGTGGTFNTPSIGANTTYYVEETNGTCNSNRTSVLATFTPSDAITASSNVGYVCSNGANTSANLTAASTNGNYSYTWNPGGLIGANVTVTPGSTTTYTVTGVDGFCTNTATVTVNVGLVPTINSTTATPAILCVSGTSQLIVDAGQLSGSYCIPTVGITGGTGDYVENFSFNTISNTSSGDNPSDYALYPQTTTVTAGSTYALSATPGSAYGQGIGVWMDFNRNGSFTDPGEFVFASPSGTSTVGTNVTIPANASSGLTRIRVAAHYAATVASSESCGHTGFGEYEDYNMTIIGGLSPLSFNWTPSTGLSSTTSDAPTATVSATSTYTVDVSDALGCSTSSSVTVTVNQPSSSTDNVTACGSYTWAANGMTYTATGTYTATSLNAGGCVHTSTLNLTIACNTTVNLVCFIEGYWDGNSQMVPALFNQGEPTTVGACDSIDVELHDPLTPAIADATVRTVLNQNGTATCLFPPMTGNKYIVVKHRSAVQTWSANAEPMGTTVNYNFTTAATQAFGANQVQLASGVFGLYSGDITLDENVDLLDLGILETDISNFGSGYLPSDINGDGNVDLLDSPILETNVNNFIFSNHP